MTLDFRVMKKFVKELLEVVDEIAEEIREENERNGDRYLYAEWERKRGRLSSRG